MRAKGSRADSAKRGMVNGLSVSQDEVQPWHRLGGVEHICELRKSASVLYAIFVSILRMMYSDRDGRTFGCPDVVWNKNNQKTQMWIDTELRWEDQRPDFTPAIFVSLGEIQYDVMPTLDGQGRTVISRDGVQHYERSGTGTATLVHVCDKSGEACSLADNTENFMSSLQDQIREEYCFDNFTVIGRTPLRKKDSGQFSGKDKMLSAVSVKFSFEDAWAVRIECPILKEVSMMEDGSAELEFGDISTSTDTPLTV